MKSATEVTSSVLLEECGKRREREKETKKKS